MPRTTTETLGNPSMAGRPAGCAPRALAMSEMGQNPNPSRTLACQLPPDADIGAGRGILTHGVGTVTALESRGRPAFHSIPGRTLSQQLVGHTRRLIDHG